MARDRDKISADYGDAVSKFEGARARAYFGEKNGDLSPAAARKLLADAHTQTRKTADRLRAEARKAR